MSGKLQLVLLVVLIAGFAAFAGCATQAPGGNATATPAPTSTSTTPAPTSTVSVTDLTNQNSPEVATFTTYPSRTNLTTPDLPVGLQRIAGGFTSPSGVADAKDGSGRLFLVDQTGYVKIFYMNGTVVDQPFLDVRDRMVKIDPTYDERGLLSIAFHPNFSTNGKVYAYYSAPRRAGLDPNWSCTNHLSEFTVNKSSPNMVDNTTERVLLEVDKPYQNHNGGILLFGPTDGYLYLPLGDGGRADDTGMGHIPGTGNAQNLTTLLGKVIRIDVNTASSGRAYGIPPDNPFLSNATIPPEIYAYGFRNPAYAVFDSGGSHRMFIAMAGQRLFESVLVIYKGGAYPWNIREGTHCFDPANDFQVPNTTCRITSYSGQPLIGPVVELGHDVGDTIVGGVVYRGSNLSSLQGAYLFGTWSDESRIAGNGSLLVAMPPSGLDTATLPDAASSLTAAQNAMWTTRLVTVANNPNGRINAFVRGLYESTDREVLVLINQNGGPGLTPQNSGEVWMMVPATTSGLASTAPRNATPTPTGAAGGAAVGLNLTIKGDAFSPTNLSVPAGAQVTLTYDDRDANPHNFAIYPSLSSSDALFRTPLITGPVIVTYTFTAPATPGTYYYRSDPNSGAVGTLTVTGAGGTGTATATATGTSTAATTTAATSATATATTGAGGGTTGAGLTLTAKNNAFDKSTLSAPAGSTVTITFNNMDPGVPHNFALYTDSTASTALFKGALATGPSTTTYTFTAPSQPGTYFYRCDVHPETMTGSFVVT
jgi:plastocyanin/glucose/arabinose dehydrogenase